MDLTTPIINSNIDIFVIKNIDKLFNAESFKDDAESIINLRVKITSLLYYTGYVDSKYNTFTPLSRRLSVLYIYLKILSVKINKSIYSINYGDIIKNVDISDMVHRDLLNYDFLVLGLPVEGELISSKWINRKGLKFIIRDDYDDKITGIFFDKVFYYTTRSFMGNNNYIGRIPSQIVNKGELTSSHDLKKIYNKSIDDLRIIGFKNVADRIVDFYSRKHLEIPIQVNFENKSKLIDAIFVCKKASCGVSLGSIYVDLILLDLNADWDITEAEKNRFKEQIIMSLNGPSNKKYPFIDSDINEIIEKAIKSYANFTYPASREYMQGVDLSIIINKVTE